jgi:3-hydroxyisobutyrate dehydrogenase-like beta-hydroxyacid dehydrogenase
MKIGFIGVGLMGHGMAKNLVEKGFDTCVMGHRNRKPVTDLVKRGAKEAKTLKALVAHSDAIILCVTGTPQVEALLRGADGKEGIIDLAKAARKKLVVIDTSTAEPDSTIALAAQCKAAGITLVDAPLARTPKEAAEGKLNTMVGCDAATMKKIRPVLSAYCENVLHVGSTGAGHKVKLLNNFFSMSLTALVSELIVAAEKTGVAPKTLYEVMSKGPTLSPLAHLVFGGAVEGDYTRLKFSVKNGFKDISYAKRMFDAKLLMMPVASAAYESLKAANALGLGDEFMPSLVKAQRKLNGG